MMGLTLKEKSGSWNLNTEAVGENLDVIREFYRLHYRLRLNWIILLLVLSIFAGLAVTLGISYLKLQPSYGACVDLEKTLKIQLNVGHHSSLNGGNDADSTSTSTKMAFTSPPTAPTSPTPPTTSRSTITTTSQTPKVVSKSPTWSSLATTTPTQSTSPPPAETSLAPAEKPNLIPSVTKTYNISFSVTRETIFQSFAILCKDDTGAICPAAIRQANVFTSVVYRNALKRDKSNWTLDHNSSITISPSKVTIKTKFTVRRPSFDKYTSPLPNKLAEFRKKAKFVYKYSESGVRSFGEFEVCHGPFMEEFRTMVWIRDEACSELKDAVQGLLETRQMEMWEMFGLFGVQRVVVEGKLEFGLEKQGQIGSGMIATAEEVKVGDIRTDW